MNKQVESALQKLLASSGPIAAFISLKLGWDATTTGLIMEVAVAILTPLAAGLWGWVSNRDPALVAAISKLDPAAQLDALNKVSDAVKVEIAKALPDVATIVVKDDAKGELAVVAANPENKDIVTETQNEIDAKLGNKT